MAPRPFKPAVEFEDAVRRGDLALAVAFARDLARERGVPVTLERALQLVMLASREQPEAYDLWARRWLVRWLNEAPGAGIEAAAEVAAALADLPAEPAVLETLRRASGTG